MEALSAEYAKEGLVAIAIIVQTSSRTPPTAQTCQSWRAAGKHVKTITLYDKFFRTRNFWEQNYTALNVFVDKNHVITGKAHTDQDAQLRRLLNQATGRP